MAYLSLTCVMIKMGGVFTEGTSKGVKQAGINKLLKEQFGCDFIKDDEDKILDNLEEDIRISTIREIKAFLSGDYVGEGVKGESFSFAQQCNYRSFDNMVEDWIKITKKVPEFGFVTLINMQDNGEQQGKMGIVEDGKLLDGTNVWGFLSDLSRVL